MKHALILLVTIMLAASSASAEDNQAPKSFTIIIKDHRFTPDTLEVPAQEKVKLIIDNQDPTPEEFESHDLHREKIINGGAKGIVFIGPLEAGEYRFFGEFNEDTAQGKIVVR